MIRLYTENVKNSVQTKNIMLYSYSKPNPGRNYGSFPLWLFLITIVWNGARFITNGAGKQHILGGLYHVRRQDPDLP